MPEEKKFEEASRFFAAQYSDWVSWFYPTKGDFQQLEKKWPYFLVGTGKDELEEIIAFRQQQKQIRRREDLKYKVEHMKKTITDHLLDELIEKVKPNIKTGQEADLKNKIKQAIKEMESPYDYDDIAATVEMVLEGKYVSKIKNTRYKTYLSYAWTIGIDIISLFVLFAIFNSTYDNQQKIVLAILVLIYLAVRSIGLGVGLTALRGFSGLETEFQRIRGLLNEEISKEELEKNAQAKKTSDKAMGKSVIDGIFLFVAYISTVWVLLSALGII